MRKRFISCQLSNNLIAFRYETVVIGGTLPATPEHESTNTVGTNELLPQPINPNALQARHSEGDIGGRRLSPAWHRTSSEISLTSFENDADRESLRRYA